MSYKYEYTRLLVSNFKACFLFYRDIMGFQAGFGTEDDTYADFITGSVTIALFDKNEMSAAVGTSQYPANLNGQDKTCLVFAVENVDSASNQLITKGVDLVVEATDHTDWGIRTAHFRDPDGNLIEINQPLPK
jgi:catechol 2,3-dioxygenase-like lactoylglutathione lyase family enzyme